jgi:hypothetical protein
LFSATAANNNNRADTLYLQYDAGVSTQVSSNQSTMVSGLGLTMDHAANDNDNNNNNHNNITPTAAAGTSSKNEPASSPFFDNHNNKNNKLQTTSHNQHQRRLVEYFIIVKSQETKTPEQERADYLKNKLLQDDEDEDVEDRNYSFFNFGNHDAPTTTGSGDAGDDLSYVSGPSGRRMSGSSVHTVQSKQTQQLNQNQNNTNNNRPAFSNDSLTFEEQFRLEWRTEFTPVISGRYPAFDHAENPLSESVTCFCHPTGFIQPREEPQMPKIHFFVTTGAKGQLMYGTCLTLWEPLVLKKKKRMFQDDGMPVETIVSIEVHVPKVLCLLSAWPFLTAFREFLTQLHRITKSCTMTVPLERFIVNFCAEIPAPPPGTYFKNKYCRFFHHFIFVKCHL